MAKILSVISRRPLKAEVHDTLLSVGSKILPDNIEAKEAKCEIGTHHAFAVYNPTSSVIVENSGFILGSLFEPCPNWNEPLKEYPDGSFAIGRCNNGYAEFITDPAATRTLWYFCDKEQLIVSSSQRAIIMLLGSFSFNREIVPWMLSTGTLGPGFSWDSRLKQVPLNGSIVLDRKNWVLKTRREKIVFDKEVRSDTEHEDELREKLLDTFSALSLDFAKWTLPLSGGVDSRAILCFLVATGHDVSKLRAVTWGLEASMSDKGNDAYIAHKLAAALKVSHEYHPTDPSADSIAKVFERFIVCGEGRIDHFAAYTDGFETWRVLYESGVRGMIRGDEGFGWRQKSSRLTIRHTIGCALCDDFENLRNYRSFGFPEQRLPEELRKSDDESLATWRDRLYHEYRLPIVLAALSDLKLGYVEIINPLLGRSILEEVRRIPDHLRTEKLIFRRIARELSPDIEYATRAAIGKPDDILRTPAAVDLLKAEMKKEHARGVFPQRFLEIVSAALEVEDNEKLTKRRTVKSTMRRWRRKLRRAAIRRFPQGVKNALMDYGMKRRVDPNVLAFRVYLVLRMKRLLDDDAKRTQ